MDKLNDTRTLVPKERNVKETFLREGEKKNSSKCGRTIEKTSNQIMRKKEKYIKMKTLNIGSKTRERR